MCVRTVEHYSAIKRNDMMPFAATWMDLEITTLSEVSQRQISYDTICMWNLKYDTNESIYKSETDSQTWRTALWLPREAEEGWVGSLGLADANYYI